MFMETQFVLDESIGTSFKLIIVKDCKIRKDCFEVFNAVLFFILRLYI